MKNHCGYSQGVTRRALLMNPCIGPSHAGPLKSEQNAGTIEHLRRHVSKALISITYNQFAAKIRKCLAEESGTETLWCRRGGPQEARGTAAGLLKEERPPEGLIDLFGAPSSSGARRGAAAGEDKDVDETPHQTAHLLHGHHRPPAGVPTPFSEPASHNPDFCRDYPENNPALITLHSEPYIYAFSFSITLLFGSHFTPRADARKPEVLK